MKKYERTIEILKSEAIEKRKRDFLAIKKKLAIDDTAEGLEGKLDSLQNIQSIYHELLEAIQTLNYDGNE